MDNRSGVSCHIYYSEYDYVQSRPTLVLQGEFGSIGYDVDPETGDLTRCCICFAYHETECSCGGIE